MYNYKGIGVERFDNFSAAQRCKERHRHVRLWLSNSLWKRLLLSGKAGGLSSPILVL